MAKRRSNRCRAAAKQPAVIGKASGSGKLVFPEGGSRRPAQILQELLRTDACGLEDDRQATAGVRATADQIHAIEFYEAVLRAKVQHLAEVVGEVKGCTLVDSHFAFPVCRRRNALIEADALLDVLKANLN